MTAHAISTESVELPSTRQIARKLGVVAVVLAVGAVIATQLPGLKDIGHQLAEHGGWIAAALVPWAWPPPPASRSPSMASTTGAPARAPA